MLREWGNTILAVKEGKEVYIGKRPENILLDNIPGGMMHAK